MIQPSVTGILFAPTALLATLKSEPKVHSTHARLCQRGAVRQRAPAAVARPGRARFVGAPQSCASTSGSQALVWLPSQPGWSAEPHRSTSTACTCGALSHTAPFWKAVVAGTATRPRGALVSQRNARPRRCGAGCVARGVWHRVCVTRGFERPSANRRARPRTRPSCGRPTPSSTRRGPSARCSQRRARAFRAGGRTARPGRPVGTQRSAPHQPVRS